MTTETVKVLGIRKVKNPEYVGDIGVKDNHNLYLSSRAEEPSVLVHNCWSYISYDKHLAELFVTGRELRKQYRENPTPELAKAIKVMGDIHRLNAKAFFGVDPNECTDEQRQNVKAIAFGAIYGKSIRSLAASVGISVAEMTEIYGMFFGAYKKAKKWLDDTVKNARETLYTNSPFGRKRRLFGYMTGVQSVMAAMDRRAMNSPIQGMAADIGHAASWLYLNEYYKFLLHFEYMTLKDSVLPNCIEAMVHDSSRQEVKVDMLIPNLQIQQYVYTKGIADWYEDKFNLEGLFSVPLEVEFEVGYCDVSMRKFDWSNNQLKDIIKLGIEEHSKEMLFEDDYAETQYELAFKEIKRKDVRKYLNETYPFFA